MATSWLSKQLPVDLHTYSLVSRGDCCFVPIEELFICKERFGSIIIC